MDPFCREKLLRFSPIFFTHGPSSCGSGLEVKRTQRRRRDTGDEECESPDRTLPSLVSRAGPSTDDPTSLTPLRLWKENPREKIL